METVLVILSLAVIGYIALKIYSARTEKFLAENARAERLQLASLEVLDELSRRYENDQSETQDYWVNLSDILVKRLDKVVSKKDEELSDKEAQFVKLLDQTKTNKANQADVFNQMFVFLKEY